MLLYKAILKFKINLFCNNNKRYDALIANDYDRYNIRLQDFR